MGLQAAEIKLRKGTFWGVQYHPEYSCAEIAAMARRYADVLIRDGLVKDQAELDALAADLVALNAGPTTRASRGVLASGPSITDPASSSRSCATGSTSRCCVRRARLMLAAAERARRSPAASRPSWLTRSWRRLTRAASSRCSRISES